MEVLNLLHSDIIALLVTLKLALTTCICLAIIGTPIAYFLAFSSSKGKAIIESIVTLPLVLPPTVIGFYLIVFFSPETKLGQFFILLTGEQLVFSFYGLVLASIIYSLPFWVQPLQSSFENIGKQTIQTSNSLGAGPFDTFLNVILPSSISSIEELKFGNFFNDLVKALTIKAKCVIFFFSPVYISVKDVLNSSNSVISASS